MAEIVTPVFESSEFEPNSHTVIVTAGEFEQIRLVGISYTHQTPSIRFADLDDVISKFKPQTTFSDSASFTYSTEYHFAVNRNTQYIKISPDGINVKQCYVENIADLPHDAEAVYGVSIPSNTSTNTFTLTFKTRAVFRDSESGAITGYGQENATPITVTFEDVIETNYTKTAQAIKEAIAKTDSWRKNNRVIKLSRTDGVSVRGGDDADAKVYEINADGTLKERVIAGTQLYIFGGSWSVSQNEIKKVDGVDTIRETRVISDTLVDSVNAEYAEAMELIKTYDDYADIKAWAEKLMGSAQDASFAKPEEKSEVRESGEHFTVRQNLDPEDLDSPIVVTFSR